MIKSLILNFDDFGIKICCKNYSQFLLEQFDFANNIKTTSKLTFNY